jgi:hypothetical protein
MANSENNGMTGQRSATGSASTASTPPVKAGFTWKAYLLTFAVTVLVVWGAGTFAAIYFMPRLWYSGLENAVLDHGLGVVGSPGIPINTLYTQPALATPSQSNSLLSTGNHDTLYTVGWLDLSKEPMVLHVPDMSGRYYSVQFTDPWGTDFAYAGRRTTGTQAGDYLITGPDWKGTVPAGMTQIAAPNNTVALLGRTLVESDSDLATAYGLAKQIQVTPLSKWQPTAQPAVRVIAPDAWQAGHPDLIRSPRLVLAHAREGVEL